MTEYEILCKHLPSDHRKVEYSSEAFARDMERSVLWRRECAAVAANPYGGFTLFLW